MALLKHSLLVLPALMMLSSCTYVAPTVDTNEHTHAAISKCTNSVKHSHVGGANKHSHKYSCKK